MTEREYLLAATMAAKRYENADLIQQGVEVTGRIAEVLPRGLQGGRQRV